MRRIRIVRPCGSLCLLLGQALDMLDDSVGVQVFGLPATSDSALYTGDGMFGQQL